MKTKFILFGTNMDYDRISMADIINKENVSYVEPGLNTRINTLRVLHKLHNSKKINKYIRLPLKEFWFSLYYDKSILQKNDNIYFVFFELNYLAYNHIFISYLKRAYPNSKLVYRFSNPINENIKEKLDFIKKQFDLVLTFDKNDAIKYGINFVEYHYSKIKIDSSSLKSDVFFVGANKGRLGLILEIYEKLQSQGLNCDFNIIDVNKNEMKYIDDITYNKRLSYMDVLKKVQNSRWILEILQDGQNGYTLRTREAIAYNKKLLTNNHNIIEEPFYNEKYISTFKLAEDIDVSKLKKNNEEVDYNYINNISPVNLLNYIENFFYKRFI